MFRTQLNAVAGSARRVLPSLGLVAALCASVLGPPFPAATAAQRPESATRLQVVVHEVKVHDDREGILSRDGEMRFFVGIWRCNQGVPLLPEMQELFAALRGNQADTDRFLGTVAGTVPIQEFFARENTRRILAGGRGAPHRPTGTPATR